jgi:hypothetical protein
MNVDIESAECIYGMCSACRYEDCACECHAPDEALEDIYERQNELEFRLNGYC